jgi:hypothetical protein
LPAEAVAHDASGFGLRRRIASVRARIAHWIWVAVDYYEAAAMYDQLYQLSDLELHRRGLSRETLAHDVAEASAHTAGHHNAEACNGLQPNHPPDRTRDKD